MLYPNTLNEIRTNINTGVEYEIALFYQLLVIKPNEQRLVHEEIMHRRDPNKVFSIIRITDNRKILDGITSIGLSLFDVSFETQNDEVGPSDIVLYCHDQHNRVVKKGLSVKFSNTCTLNVTGRKFITGAQIAGLRYRYETVFLPAFIQDMTERFGNAANWHRKTSSVTDRMIDEIRDAVIFNWPYVQDKAALLRNLFHDESPIEFWVLTYTRSGYELKMRPSTIDMNLANNVTIRKYQTSYLAFYLGNERVGHMQVKFNNGFIESNFNHRGERKKRQPDFIRDGLEFNYGQPFGSWNFSVEE